MAANITDLMSRVTDSNSGRPIIGELASPGKAIGAASLNLAAATNWTTDSAIHFAIYETTTVGNLTVKDTTTQTDWKGTLSGTTIGNLTITGGTDRAYTAGAIVEITPTARYAKDMYDWAMAGHNQNGTHKVFTESDIVPTAAIQDEAVTTAKIDDGAVTNAKLNTTAGELGGAWQSWTPTLSGRLNNTKWTKDCKYTQIGKTVHFKFWIKASTTTPMDGGTAGAFFTLPVTATVNSAEVPTLGTASFLDAGTARGIGVVEYETTTIALLRYFLPQTTYTGDADPTSTTPFTWTTNDEIYCQGEYEAA